MKFVITEEEKKQIRGLYDLLNEQSSSLSIPQSAIKAISDIESVFSYMSGGKIQGKKYSGDEMVGVMEKYVKDTIGLDCWNNMRDLMKAQIYSFCFQADTSTPYKMKFIAGLANAIDPTISRSNIVGKPLKDPNVQNAINVIKKNCSSINNYYNDYMRIMDNQYSSMDYNDNYKNIWKYRPTAITRLMNGESWSKVKEDWKSSLTDKVETPTEKTNEKIVVQGSDLDDLRTKMKALTNLSINPKSFNVYLNQFKVEFESGDTKVKSLSFIFDDKGEMRNRLPQILAQNPTMKVAFQGKSGNIEYAVLYFE